MCFYLFLFSLSTLRARIGTWGKERRKILESRATNEGSCYSPFNTASKVFTSAGLLALRFLGVLLEFRGLFVLAAEEEGKGAALFLPPGRLFVLFSDSRFVISMHSVGKWEGFAKMAVGVYFLVGVLLHSSDRNETQSSDFNIMPALNPGFILFVVVFCLC